MNKDLIVTYLNSDKVLIIWDKENVATNYDIIGMDGLFVNNVITSTEDNRIVLSYDDIKDYLKICVKYISRNKDAKKEIVIGSSNYWEVQKVEYESIDVRCIKSYHGISISFLNENIFDKYYVYEVKDDIDELIIETEDFQTTSNKFKVGNKYYVEAYMKENDVYVLKAKSEVFECELSEIKKESKINVSVVVPTYNAELFLSRTVDSLLLSTLKGMEIILVNDGSKDNSIDVMNWYKKNYKGIVSTYSQENQGLSYARNAGLEHVKGEYVAFMDSDDMVHPFMFEKLFNLASKNNLDAAIGKTLIRRDINEHDICLNVQKDPDKEDLIYTFEEMIKEDEKKSWDNIFFVSPCNKILRTSIVKAHPFPKFNHYEDTAFTMTAYSYIDKFGFNKKAYYMWDKRFRKTVGTYTTTYSDVGSVLLNIKFVTALFNVPKNGNPERLNYLAYYAIRDIFNYLTKSKYDLYGNKFAWAYIQEIQDLNRKIDLLNDPYIQYNKSIYSFVEKVLKRRPF